MTIAEPLTGTETGTTTFAQALPDFVLRLRAALGSAEAEDWDTQRRIGPAVLDELSASRILSAFIPQPFGGGGAGPIEVLSLLEAASYESLPLGLSIGINLGLFLQPLTKYGGDAIKEKVFRRFTGEGALGGLMLTEPDYGTDLLSMRCSYERRGGEYQLRGTKHWAGLSGRADFWLLSARERREDGSLKRDIDFFVCDSSQPGQEIVMEERYPSLGLRLLPYGRNRVELSLPLESRLEAPGSGVRLLLDLLHRSRLSFGGMAVGFLERLLDEGLARCRSRIVGGKRLLDYDQVERRLSEIQAASTIAAAFCAHSTGLIGLANDLSGEALAANSHKALLTDLMEDSAQSLLQLSGAEGFRLDSLAGRAIVDSRPFQIFEGSNDVLYDQIGLAYFGAMRAGGGGSLASFLSRHELTRRAAGRFRVKGASSLDFAPEEAQVQRRSVDFGRIVARAAAADRVIGLGEAGYPQALVEGALAVLEAEVSALAAGYAAASPALVAAEGSARWQEHLPGRRGPGES
jgi:alkylation response protein AidB-like acyl-CoA dehydrogenase